MNGVHDMGGMHGFGPVVREENEPVFHEAWEGRVYCMLRQFGAAFPVRTPGLSRDIIENIPPLRYLAMSYYERFLQVLEQRALHAGLITSAELETRTRQFQSDPATPVARRLDPERTRDMLAGLQRQLRPAPDAGPPRFIAGDRVRARNLNWPGHNRLPRYIRGKRGIIERVNGRYAIEDAHAERLGADPQHVYTVRFDGEEVWGPGCEANLRVYLELWEGYLEPAGGER